MARYSLANYTLAITLPSELATILGLTGSESLVVGGEGSYLDSITISLNSKAGKGIDSFILLFFSILIVLGTILAFKNSSV